MIESELKTIYILLFIFVYLDFNVTFMQQSRSKKSHTGR